MFPVGLQIDNKWFSTEKADLNLGKQLFDYSNSAPVNNHHPSYTTLKAYPNLGRQLTVADIGKKILRVYPYQLAQGEYDWSYMPHDAKVTASDIMLMSLDNKTITFYNHCKMVLLLIFT